MAFGDTIVPHIPLWAEGVVAEVWVGLSEVRGGGEWPVLT